MSLRRQHIRNTRAVIEAGTPLIGEYPYDTDLKTIRAGDGVTLGGHPLAKWGKRYTVTPAQIVANTNDYNPANLAIAEVLELTSDAARNITGIAGTATDRVLWLVNSGAFTITLKDADAASTAANRFSFGADFKLRSKMAVALIYLASASRWLLLSDAFAWKYINDIPEDLSLSGDLSPAAIAANTNDYAPAGLATAVVLRLSTDASRNLTGITGGRDGRILVVRNAGANPLVLKNEDAGSTAANRFDFGADVTLAAKNHAVIQYDATDSRWKLLSSTAGSAVADGAVTGSKLAASAAGGSIINGKLVWSVAGSALTVALKTLADADPSAADPVWVRVRDTAATTDAADWIKITAALSLVVSSGSSLGTTNATAFRIWAELFNDAGTPRIGVINCWSGTNIYPLGAEPIASSTAEGGAGGADSAYTFYTGTAVASKPYAVLGYASWETGLAAAGTWSAGPTRVQMFGPGVRLPGQIVQKVVRPTSSVATGTTAIPLDDTIPQSTEGDQYMSSAVTPWSAANLLAIEAKAVFSTSASGGARIAMALFQDATANALAGTIQGSAAPSNEGEYFIRHHMLAALTTATTFKVRASNGGGTTTFNGDAGSRLFGGVMNSYIDIEEIMT